VRGREGGREGEMETERDRAPWFFDWLHLVRHTSIADPRGVEPLAPVLRLLSLSFSRSRALSLASVLLSF